MATIKKKQRKINKPNTIQYEYLEYLDKTVNVKIDRPLNSLHPKYGFRYEVNYGFVPDTKAPDGEEIDAYVLGVYKPLKRFRGVCIALVHRLNDNDDKLVIVPKDYNITDQEIRKAIYFQEKYFKSMIFRSHPKDQDTHSQQFLWYDEKWRNSQYVQTKQKNNTQDRGEI